MLGFWSRRPASEKHGIKHMAISSGMNRNVMQLSGVNLTRQDAQQLLSRQKEKGKK
jgi:hypothetical protein